MNKEILNTNLTSICKTLIKIKTRKNIFVGTLSFFPFFPLFFLVSLFIFCIFCIPSQASAEDYTAYAKEQEQRVKGVIAPYKAEIDELVKNVSIRQSQPDIQAFKKEITNISKTQCTNQYQDSNSTAGTAQISTSTPILIFVSFSMLKESIKSWISQAKEIGAAVYIRGLVNNSFKDTTKAVLELVQDQPGGLLIDPTVFKKYSIAQVPAVVVSSSNHSNDFDVIYGDVTLDYALEKISKVAQKKDREYLLDAVKKLRNKDQEKGKEKVK